MLKCSWGVIMLDEYKDKQSLFYEYVTKSIKAGKVSHAYLIEKNNVSYAYDLAISFVKHLLNADLNTSLQIDSLNYPDIKVIKTDKEIKKDQVVELQDAFKVKPLYGDYLIYVIDDVSNLNNSAANTILKFLEEPSPKIIAVLLCNNFDNVIDTIVSRCQLISLVPEDVTLNDIKSKFSDSFTLDDVVNFYFNVSLYKDLSIAYTNPYIFRDNIKLLLEVGIYFYTDVLHFINGNHEFLFNEYFDLIEKMAINNDNNAIIKKIDIIIGFLADSKYNVNKDLFLDNFVIALGG